MDRFEKAAETLMGVKDTGHSKGFQILVRQIGESKTKHVSQKPCPTLPRTRDKLPSAFLADTLTSVCSSAVLYRVYLCPAPTSLPSLYTQEEDRIIKKEAVFLKETIGSPSITSVSCRVGRCIKQMHC